MKKILAILVAAVLSVGASAQLVNAFHEVAYTDDGTLNTNGYPVGGTTYRIYASLADAADILSAVYAVNNDVLILGSDAEDMWNTSFGSAVGSNIGTAFFGTFPEIEWDSFVTVGRANDGDPGVGITALAILPDPLAIENALGGIAPAAAADLVLNDGNWFSTPGAANTFGTGVDNRVLLAQVTTTGDVQYQLNVQVLDGGLGGTSLLYVANPASTDGADINEPTLAYPSVVPTGCTDNTACNYDPAAIIDDLSCDFSCYGCTDEAGCNYDVSFTIDDGSCNYECYGCTDNSACNFVPGATVNSTGVYAPACFYPGDACDDGNPLTTGDEVQADCSCAGQLALSLSPYGSCNAISASNDGVSPSVFTLTTASPGLHLEVITSDFDVQIDLDGPGVSTDFSINDVAGAGSEIFNGINLQKNVEYTITITSNGGSGNFTICAEDLPETKFDYAPGEYDLCDIVKADWVGAENYRFRFIPFVGDIVEYETGAAYTFALLREIDGLLPGIYFVRCDAGYTVTNSSGGTEFVWILGDTPTTVTVVTPQNISVRNQDVCANHGPHFLGDYIAATPYSCGVVDWQWTFTPASGGLPITHNRGSGNRYLRLITVPGLVGGQTYDVTVQGLYANGATTNLSAVACIEIIGTAPSVDGGPVIEYVEEVVVKDDSDVSAAIYPNPTSGDVVNVNLNNVSNEVVTLDIFDSFGKLVQSQQLTVSEGNINQVISVSNLASGVYMVNIGLENQIITERLVIQK